MIPKGHLFFMRKIQYFLLGLFLSFNLISEQFDIEKPKIELLIDGQEAFPEIIRCIDTAKETLYINAFIWRDDRVGNLIAERVLAAANRGVKIKISKDKIGQIHECAEENMQSFFHKKTNLKNSLKIFGLKVLYPSFRMKFVNKKEKNSIATAIKNHPNIETDINRFKHDHSKYFIFDDSTIIVGGINIEDKELYTDIKGQKYNDYMLKITSKSFLKKFHNRLKNKQSFNPNSHLDIIFNNIHSFNLKHNLIRLIDSAEQSIIIENSYWGDKDILKSIDRAVKRGVAVTIFIPEEANLQNDLNKKIISNLYKSTNKKVTIYENPNMLHAKAMAIDNKILTLGSANLNSLSLTKMYELNVVLKQKNLLTRYLKHIEKQKKVCSKISAENPLKYDRIISLIEGIFS